MPDCLSKSYITVVTVTYGDRWQYLQVLLRRLEQEELVHDVVVVDNASTRDIAVACSLARFLKPHVYRQERNLGSAGGYNVGIKGALTLHNDFIMLLDDDVVPDQECFFNLLNDYQNIYKKKPYANFAVIPYRQSHFSEITESTKYEYYNFQGLNIFTIPHRIFNLQKKIILSQLTPNIVYEQRGTAYAGLYFNRSLITEIGLPNPDFVLYYDDMEFTYRILKNCGQIWLDPSATCDDICKNYSMNVFSPPIVGYLNADSDAKIFYMIRNKTYLDCFVYETMSFYYVINVIVFLIGITLIGVLTCRWHRVRIIYRAVLAGCHGRLGVHPDYQLI